ncbi:hypothetical protein V496_00142 [Pseudogymnoascus sp. VKM F-4515 (FW-2607)]|nr:hypothetical protein V496_00142 [Pseudogymnoascus sp. VKM F-4515 (FW-2607)]KFY95667.1 hypothetical protein V498_03213 [Pseudogymnoascus sp. VKM F-4517 (FW-2822)]
MATTTVFALVALSKALSWNEALSGVFGSISLATWIFLLVPQLILNYTTGSADGISLAFLTVWLLGDITNLAGAIWAGLVPTVTALAVYFCFADFVLISQCLFYNHLNARREAFNEAAASPPSEEAPLLARERSNESIGHPGARRRSSTHLSHSSGPRRDSLVKILDDDDSAGGSSWKRNTWSILMVILVGTAGWAIAWQSGVWRPTPKHPGDVPGKEQVAVGASVLGYLSALCYLGARIPQIIKNHKDKSCEGEHSLQAFSSSV